MSKRIFGGLAAAVMLAGGLAFGSAGTVAADAVNDGKVCVGLSSGKIDTSGEPQTITITPADYPAGNVITGYCVKAGSDNQEGGGPVYVDVPQGTTTVTFGHPSGKAVSHYSFSYAPPVVVVIPPTPTPNTPVPPTPNPVTPTETPAGQTPTQAAPAGETSAQADVVAALPPTQVGSSGATTQVVVPAQGLPSTGIDGTGITALVALIMTSLGGAALFMSRRRNVMT